MKITSEVINSWLFSFNSTDDAGRIVSSNGSGPEFEACNTFHKSFQRFKQKLIATGGYAVQECKDKSNLYTVVNPAFNIQLVERSGQHLNVTPSNRKGKERKGKFI